MEAVSIIVVGGVGAEEGGVVCVEGDWVFGGGEVVEVFARGCWWSVAKGRERGVYQVRRRQVRSVGGQEERIIEWISGGKEVKSGKVVDAAEDAILTQARSSIVVLQVGPRIGFASKDN
jgi:hypothetical protein